MSIVIFIDVPEIMVPSSLSLSDIYSFIPLFLFNGSIIVLANMNLIPTICKILDKSLMGEKKRIL